MGPRVARFACGRSPHAEEHIVEGRGIGLMAYARSPRNTDLEEHWRIHWPCVNQHSGNLNAIHVGHGDCGRSRLRNKSRIAEAKHDRVWVHDVNGTAVFIDSWRQDEVLARRERGIDLGERV